MSWNKANIDLLSRIAVLASGHHYIYNIHSTKYKMCNHAVFIITSPYICDDVMYTITVDSNTSNALTSCLLSYHVCCHVLHPTSRLGRYTLFTIQNVMISIENKPVNLQYHTTGRTQVRFTQRPCVIFQ